MKAKIFCIEFILIFAIFIFICNVHVQAEIPAEKHMFSIMQSISYPLSYYISAEVTHPAFKFFSKAESSDLPLKLSLIPQGFNLKFTPLFYFENKKPKPALSFFYGGIVKAAFINKLSFKTKSKKMPFYQGVNFAPDYSIDISKAKFGADLGVEFSIKNIGLFFVSEQDPRKLWPDLYFYTVYKNKTNKKLFNLVFFSSLTNTAYSQLNLKKPNYNQFYLGKFIIENENNLASSVFLLSGGIGIPYPQTNKNEASFSGKVEYNLRSKYFFLNTGGLFSENGTLDLFIQPKFSISVLDIGIVYNFSRNYLETQHKIKTTHSAGLGSDLHLSNFKFNGELFYEDNMWKLNGEIKIPLKFFLNSLFIIKGSGKFEDKFKNPFIVKSYIFSSNIELKFSKQINLSASADFSQKNKLIKKGKLSYIGWEKPEFHFCTKLEIKKESRNILNYFKGEIKFQTSEPIIKASLAYKISF